MAKGKALNVRETRLHFFVVAVCVFCYAPHIRHLAPWITVVCFLFWFYGIGVVRWGLPCPGKRLRALMSLAALAAVVIVMRQLWGMAVALPFLVILLSMKSLEMNSGRDRMLVLMLCYFVLALNFFYAQDIGMTLYVLMMFIVITAVWLSLRQRAARPAAMLRQGALFTLQALPIAAFLFLVFPRLSSGLGLRDPSMALSGFTTVLAPQTISRLAQNSAVAFRVQFHGRIPPSVKRYWRGLVLWEYDGWSWQAGKFSAEAARPLQGRDSCDYTVILEPTGTSFLFALDLPDKAPAGTRLLSEYTLQAGKPVDEKKRYQVRSFLSYTNRRSPHKRPRSLMLTGGNPRARALADQWKKENKQPQQIVRRALAYFRANGFFYTLTPPPLKRLHPIDGFLFESRRGFCGHYASAFAFLMRAAGVPARIVVGYQGGEKNPLGDYFRVRQSDAHAWCEVWYDERGWQRIDPTAEVSPARIESGLTAALSADPMETDFFTRISRRYRAIRTARLYWDLANFRYSDWVLSYDFEKQRRLFSAIRIPAGPRFRNILLLGLTLLAVFLTTAAAGLLAYRALMVKARHPVPRLYSKFCRIMARQGVRHRPWEGPRDYARRITSRRADLAESVLRITDLYIRLHYGRAGKRTLKQFRQAVSRLSGKK